VGVIQTPGGERVLPVFRSREAAEAAELPTTSGALIVAAGSHVFRLKGFDRVDIDPGTESALSLGGDDLVSLGIWGEVADVERAIVAPEMCETPFVTLRIFSRYFVVVADSEGSPDLLMAPDAGGRKLLAVFTADDAVEAFVASLGVSEGVATTMSGEELFFALRELPLDGFVFNCCGPVATRAFAMGAIDRILTSGQSAV
jgi:hypothetical protein